MIVEKYLSEGGFAHVYVVRVPTAGGSAEPAVLKRVAVPDKDALASMRTEVETMKKLKGHKHIVTYIDSHASQLQGGGYEVFLLMEYCDGGGLIDFMNTRLKNRLTEPEILKIFSDAAEGVATMHYLKPPLLHRDLKVENILISKKASEKLYKLCDFGSTAPPRPAASSAVEGRLIEDDVQRHTTLQYRSPEMIDVYRRQPIDEKSDIWALGVLLYKLCYYTTPFEEQGQMAILTASFKYPPYPKFSDRLKKLIAEMLSENPKNRPNVYKVLAEVCSMRGTRVPIKDIYAARTPSEARSNQRLPSPEPDVKPASALGSSRVPVEQTKQTQPEITPMRRGRPSSPSKTPASTETKKGRDPFAALDSPSFDTRSKAVDELSSRFPPPEQFGILQNKRQPFNFEGSSTTQSALNDKVTAALADEAFAAAAPEKPKVPTPVPDEAAPRVARAMSLKKTRSSPPPQTNRTPRIDMQKPLPSQPQTTRTDSLPKSDPPIKPFKPPPVSDRPIWRVPSPQNDRTSTLEPPTQRRTADRPRPTSQFLERTTANSPASSRQSFEGSRPSALVIPQVIHRSRSADERTLSPTKTTRLREEMESQASRERPHLDLVDASEDDPAAEDSRLSSIDYLRQLEDESSLPSRNDHRRKSSTLSRLKHASVPPSHSGGKQLFGGRFNSAFKRFEHGRSESRRASEEPEVIESRACLTNGSSAVRASSPVGEDLALVETEELSPEVRRELERRRLSLEERRVANAGAAHRAGTIGRGGQNRATGIQNRVKDLLDESGRTSPVKKTASGYGKYTSIHTPPDSAPPPADTFRTRRPLEPPLRTASVPSSSATTQTAPARPPRPTTTASNRPTAPPKPVALQTGSATPTVAAEAERPRDPMATITDPSELDWHYDFSQRYPDVSLDAVEDEIVLKTLPARTSSLKVREV